MSHRSTSQAAEPANALARRRLLASIGLGVTVLLGACGKRGPLRLPEPAPSDAAEETE